MLEYIEKGLIKKRKHPKYDLYIYGYSDKCVYERIWDKVTINTRGLILDGNDNFVATSFPKFFNFEELLEQERVPKLDFVMEEKLDGSLGILFHYNGEWIFATRGSFEGEIAERFKAIFEAKYDYGFLDKSKTYIFEILSEINKIVVRYNEEDLVLLTVFKGPTEIGITNEKKVFRTPKLYEGYSFEKLKALDLENEEGVVVRFSDGSRMKIKFQTYLEIHRKINNITERSIARLMLEGKSLSDIIEGMPDERFKFILNTYNKMTSEIADIFGKINREWYKYGKIKDRKEFALAIKDNDYKRYLFIMFSEGKLFDTVKRDYLNTY